MPARSPGRSSTPHRKEDKLHTARCLCGFTEDADETIMDHLLRVFEPDDSRGTDGLVHEEVAPPLTCSCGFTAMTSADLDGHFLRAFIPEDAIAPDGRKHGKPTSDNSNGAADKR